MIAIYWLKDNGTSIDEGPIPLPSVINRNGFNISNPKEQDVIAAGGLIEPDKPVITENQRLEIKLIGGVLSWNIIDFIPEVIIPNVVTMRQARVYLSRENLLTTVNDAVNSQGGEAQVVWEYSHEVQRSNPLTAQIALLLGWTETDLDTMFLEASQL